jgi:hypothetical protein
MANWTREQLLIALNLYHKVSFGKFHAKNKMCKLPQSSAIHYWS